MLLEMAGWVYFVLFLIIHLQTKVNGQCLAPWNVTLQKLHVSWSGEERDADVRIYVNPKEDDLVETNCARQNLTAPFSRKEIWIQPFCSNTTYSVVAGLICEGKSYVQKQAFNIRSDDILPPYNVTSTRTTNSSIKLEWNEPIFSERPIIAYHVQKSKTHHFEIADIYHTSTTAYELAGLVPHTVYFIQVRASTETTVGPWSTTLSAQTNVGVPFPPLNVHADSVTNSSIVVKWNEPKPSYGPIISYAIKWNKESDPEVGNSTNVDTPVYKIEGLDPYTAYSVQVSASTEAGPGPWSSAVIVWTDVGIPGTPTGLVATNTSATSIHLSWNASEPANGPSLEYVVAWGVRGSAISQVLVNDTEFLAVNLQPVTEYAFQVAARTSVGLSSYSKRLFVWTEIDYPSQPLNLTVVEVTNTSILIEWDPPESPNGPILAYVIQFLEHPNGTVNETEVAENATTLEGLNPNTIYIIRVCARTKAGLGPYTDHIEVQTGVGVPGPPTEILFKVNATSIFLTWDHPVYIPGPLEDYLVTWGVVGTPASLVVISNAFCQYSAIGLRPYTEYSFEVAARTEAGAGSPVSETLRTDVAAPSFPRELRAVEQTENSIFLKWLPPEHPNGPNLNYRVKCYSENASTAIYSDYFNSTSHNFTGLEPVKSYFIQVVAGTSAGEGPWSSVVNASTKEKKPSSNSTLVLAIVLGIVLPLLLIILITGIIIARRKRVKKSTSSPATSQPIPAPRPTIELETLNKTSRAYTVHNFEENMNTITRYGRAGFLQEFEDLNKASPRHSCNSAKVEENLTKNRWVKILPFDHTRVKLHPDGTGFRPNFINANYIPGDSFLLEYIATQGPLPNTVNDFWALVWQQYAPVIVMLTQCVERAVKNCEKYWPSSGEIKLYGDIQVQTKSETMLTNHIMRVFTLQHQNQQRHLVQMHFTNWPVSGCPRSPGDFLHFVQMVRSQVSDRRPGPILVHCSAGVGRTGTYIAVDRLMQHLQNNEDIDIFGTVLDMRSYRPHMVHTVDQYIFIYSCVQQMIHDKKETQENIYETVP